MNRKWYIFLILVTLFAHSLPLASAQERSARNTQHDSLRVSLLTCAQGDEIYSLFGHTAIRCENLTQKTDVVYNYGIFNFHAPHFFLRFALGKTDYLLGASTFARFASEYQYMGREVWQQTLNLRCEEKELLFELLADNYLPEHQLYRYNFLYDNCATRPRDMIERAIHGTLQYNVEMNSSHTGESFRSIIHQYTAGHAWEQFGIDLVLGSPADRPITHREMMFAPFYVKAFFDQAFIVDSLGEKRPLVTSDRLAVPATPIPEQRFWEIFTPGRLFLGLFILVVAATFYGRSHRKTFWGIDLLLFAAAGIIGCVLAFLALFSQHPAVNANYLLLFFHPFHLIALPYIIGSLRKGKRNRYLLFNTLLVIAAMVAWPFIPQQTGGATLLLAGCLLVRSLNNITGVKPAKNPQRRER
jgi:hypothetical protein